MMFNIKENLSWSKTQFSSHRCAIFKCRLKGAYLQEMHNGCMHDWGVIPIMRSSSRSLGKNIMYVLMHNYICFVHNICVYALLCTDCEHNCCVPIYCV